MDFFFRRQTLLQRCIVIGMMVFLNILCLDRLQAITKTPRITSWLRIKERVGQFKMNQQGDLIAYLSLPSDQLQIVDLQDQKIYSLSRVAQENSFFWAPNGRELIYRELVRKGDQSVVTRLMNYSSTTHVTSLIREFNELSGFPTLDPLTYRFNLTHSKGVYAQKINLSGKRFASWQEQLQGKQGSWAVSSRGIFWIKEDHQGLTQVATKNQTILSYAISPHGDKIAWAANDGKIYMSEKGHIGLAIADGRDPSWHWRDDLLIYAAARKIGRVTRGYDIKIRDQNGKEKFLTAVSEARWPIWVPQSDRIVFTRNNSTDFFVIKL